MAVTAAFALITITLLFAVGCGGGDAESTTGAAKSIPLEVQDPPVHVHGLGYDESTGTLYIATHRGLFELTSTATKARRVGDSRQDTMGFTLVAPKRFLGSGHPDPRESLPSQLGLITSEDRGRTWKPVSLLGEADFHVLRARGSTVYGFDSLSGRLLASSDSGLTWTSRAAPDELVDLAVSPRDPNHLLAASSVAVYESRNGGRTWTAVAGGFGGYLAWPAPARAYLADPSGALLSSPGPAGPWRKQTPLEMSPAALLAIDDMTLVIAGHDGTILRSNDGGASWKVRATP